ncbi:LOW QUALITY PROTEIN: 3-isopropylmalate dehydratase large subunit [Frankliniella fusca]|uniref:3-isopropylmalate dehydratase large subunit n=1 Tax=Frankliniella fusca TaxID=407009 RepID=A0AAE1L7K6_9NEOP|nr:LOW QUALITY PROTEIN: 3-isopropylmalate dehydratase large subunit [Frankliniella fusca]
MIPLYKQAAIDAVVPNPEPMKDPSSSRSARTLYFLIIDSAIFRLSSWVSSSSSKFCYYGSDDFTKLSLAWLHSRFRFPS